MKYHTNLLLERLPEILDAILVWREDPKCKLRVKVRMVVMRLATRCGFEQVEKLIPDNYAKPFSHIRRTVSKKDRKKREGMSQLVCGVIFSPSNLDDESFYIVALFPCFYNRRGIFCCCSV